MKLIIALLALAIANFLVSVERGTNSLTIRAANPDTIARTDHVTARANEGCPERTDPKQIHAVIRGVESLRFTQPGYYE